MSKRKNKPEEEDEVSGVEMDENSDIESEETEEVEQTPESKLAELNNKYLLLYSDFDNFRKRTIKEKAEIISSASGSVIKDLLDVLDDFERAMSNNENVEDPAILKEGFKLIQTKLMNTLAAKGLEPMEAKGDVFDPDKHEAITQFPATDESQKGKVVDVIERGYNLKGTVLRYAKVVVGQ